MPDRPMLRSLALAPIVCAAAAAPLWAQQPAGRGGDASLPIWWYLAPIGAALALLMALVFYQRVMAQSEGEASMVRIAQAVREGAYAYLRAQWRVVAIVFIVLLIVLALMGFALGLQSEWTFAGVGVAGFLSGLCGFFGMKTATNASARTTLAAKRSLNDGLRIAFRAGAVMGLCVTGFALLDVSVWFYLLSQVFGYTDLVALTTITLSFAMGASLQALFARVGGGIYTKAADVGADLVGKVEAGIPEDDARNPATIADNVGDNVGDVAGMGADLYESYYGSILAATALAAAAAFRLDLATDEALRLVTAPATLAGLGIVCAVIGIFIVRTREGASMKQLLRSLHGGVWFSSLLIAAGGGGLLYWMLGGVEGVSWWGIWIAILAGLGAGLVIAWGTEFYTSYEHRPTRRISEQAQTGPATVIIAGVAEGMKSTWVPLLTVVAAIVIAFIAAGGNDTFLLGVFGVGIAAVGMLSTLAITLATDAYGPIADNAGGNAEMTHQEPFVRERTDMLDSLGNTTAATGKGFAIGSAALTALALLAAYVITVQGALERQVSPLLTDEQAAEPYAISRIELSEDQARRYLSGMGAPAPLLQNIPEEIRTRPVFHVGAGLFGLPDISGGGMRAWMMLAADHRQRILRAIREGREVSWTWDEAEQGWIGAVEGEGGVMRFRTVRITGASLPQVMAYFDATITNPRVLSGLFIGVMLVFVFCAMTMSAVGRAAFQMMTECRRQFGIMKEAFRGQGMSERDIADPTKWPFEVTVEGHRYPDYATCVAISTKGALREMIVPSLMAVVVPIIVGLILGVPGVMGMLAGALVCGFAVAIFMANAGGAWDNAKKWIETGQYGGKGSDAHKAGVVGDTVGDPFKDTSGPSLNILIKLISIVSVVFAGLIVRFSPAIGAALGLGG